MGPGELSAVDRILEAAVAHKAFPGAVLAVGRDRALVRLAAFGRLDYAADSPPVRPDTIYDLASLTKVVVTATAAMMLVEEGRLDLDRPVSAWVPAFSGGAKARVTAWHLLVHSSGLDWWAPLYRELSGSEAYVRRIATSELGYEPGTRSVYSDLGIILLGAVLEAAAGEALDAFARRRILGPLGMRDTGFRPFPGLVPRVAPTEDCPWRGRVLRGEVHDENAWAMGGVAAHAGLFGTAEDLARFAELLLDGGVAPSNRGQAGGRRLVSEALLRRFTARASVPGSTRALGWDTPSEEGSSAGRLMGRHAFGHTGFTGTSLWIDPERCLYVILLTNRVHPSRHNEAIRKVRPAVADAVVTALTG